MFKADDRVRETSTTNGTGDYTLDGAPTGFQAFSTLGANTFVPYYATDDTNWETGIGQVLTGPNRLSRIAIKASSNADAAVNWAGATTKKIRCGLPASMAFPEKISVNAAGSGTLTLTQVQQRASIIEFTGALTGARNIETDSDTPWRWTFINSATGLFPLTVRAVGQSGVEIYQGRSTDCIHTGVDVKKAVDDIPPGTIEDFGGTTVQPGRLALDGSNQTRTSFPALCQKLMRTATVTFTNGTDRVNWTAHGLISGDVFKFTGTGPPTGLSAGTTYFVINPTTNDFQISATEGGSAINFTTDGTGPFTGIHAPHGDGDGSTTFTLPDSRRKVTAGRGATGTQTAQLGSRLGATGGAENRTIGTTNLPASGLSVPGLSVPSLSVSVTSTQNAAVNTGNTVLLTGGKGAVHSSTTLSSTGSTGTGTTGGGTTGNMGSGTAFDEMQPTLVVTRTIRT